MTKNFPHLQDTEFPYLAGANPYEFKNDFDYTRWTDSVRLKLCAFNVDDFNRCIMDAAAKDAIFDSAAGYEFKAVSRVVSDSVKLPLPFETCGKYNYLCARFPVPTSGDFPIDYAPPIATDYFWIIEDMEYLAPNATKLYLKLDVWGTYGEFAQVSYMNLERGHAPLSQVDADAFLANPIANYDMLAAVEDSYEELRVVRSHEFEGYGNSEKYVVFAVSMDARTVGNLKDAPALHGSSWASFENRTFSYPAGLSNRTAYYYTVDDYYWGYTGKDYNDCLPNTGMPSIVDDIWSGLSFVAVSAANAFSDDFLANLYDKQPYFLKVVEYVFIASSEMLDFTDRVKLCGFDAYIVQGREWDLHEFDLAKSNFDYPAEYSNLAKLYAFPYAAIKVTDGESELLVKVQDVAKDAKAHCKAILSTLDFVTMLEGVGGDCVSDMTVKRLDGSEIAREFPRGEWQSYILKTGIPTYSIYLSKMHDLAIDSYTNDMVVTRNAAIASYHASNRAANGALHNTEDSANTSVSNCATQTAANTAINGYGNTFLENSKDANVTKLESDHSVDVITTAMSVASSAISDLMSYVVNQSAASSSAAIDFVGDLVGLRFGQAVSGAANWAVSASQASASYNITHSKDAALNGAAAAQARGKTTNAQTLLSNVTSYQKSTNSSVTSKSNESVTTQNTRTNNTLKANARYSFEDSHAADYNALSIEQQRIYAKYRDAKRSGNVAMAADSGNKVMDALEMRGIDFQIITQSNGAISRIGDEFLRFGYRFGRNWKFTTWDMMQHFTYWQASDVWFAKGDIPEFAIRTMKAELSQGLTIWRNIDDIMNVSIYDNGA